jgi:hypothetical protein
VRGGQVIDSTSAPVRMCSLAFKIPRRVPAPAPGSAGLQGAERRSIQ